MRGRLKPRFFFRKDPARAHVREAAAGLPARYSRYGCACLTPEADVHALRIVTIFTAMWSRGSARNRRRAIQRGTLDVAVRDCGRFDRPGPCVDDVQYGGGHGMVLKPSHFRALDAIRQ